MQDQKDIIQLNYFAGKKWETILTTLDKKMLLLSLKGDDVVAKAASEAHHHGLEAGGLFLLDRMLGGDKRFQSDASWSLCYIYSKAVKKMIGPERTEAAEAVKQACFLIQPIWPRNGKYVGLPSKKRLLLKLGDIILSRMMNYLAEIEGEEALGKYGAPYWGFEGSIPKGIQTLAAWRLGLLDFSSLPVIECKK